MARLSKDLYLDELINQDRFCEICQLRFECHGLTMGPNGPSYPACADGEYDRLVDEDALEDLMQEEEDNA